MKTEINLEAALITKAIESHDIHTIINAGADGSLITHKDVWKFIYEHHQKFRVTPSFDVLQQEFPEFKPEKIDASIEYLVEKIHEQHIKSELTDILIGTAGNLEDNPSQALEIAFSKISSLSHTTHIIKDVDLARDYELRVENLKKRAENIGKNDVLGIKSFVDPIDYLFGGWQKGDFVTIMGWTGSAKTWLGMYFAVNAWKQGKVPLYFSLEMDDMQFGYRIDTILAGGRLSNTSLMTAKNIDVDDYGAWAEKEFTDKHPFYLVTNEGLAEANQNTVQAKISQYKPDIVFLDYHGLFDDARRGESQTEKILNLSKDFKKMAVRNSVPIIDIVAVTQKEEHGSRVPELNEVAWSKQLAYDSDLCLSMFRDGQLVTVEAKKFRRCQPFAFKLSWDFGAGIVKLHDWN